MAEALETKKRRLYKLLDNLSSSDLSKSPSTSTTTSTKRSLTATERFVEARERASKRIRHSTSTGSLTSQPPTKVAPARSVSRKDGEDKDKPPPNFSPWSHEMFLVRLKSFSSVSLWHPKPEGVGEVEWAKRGWRCVDVNTVACKGGCERRVVVSLDLPNKQAVAEDAEEEEEDDEDDAQEALERALVARYKSVITDGHASTCMWRTAGCRDDIYRIQVIRPSVWQPELRKRCKSLLDISPSLINLTLQTQPTDGLKTQAAERLLTDLPPDLTGRDAFSASDAGETSRALTIALHGWRGAREAGADLLHCDACFQRIGLWMYQPDYKRPHTTSSSSDEDAATLDLTELHREHCPWRNSAAQNASGSLAGLNASQVLQRVVGTYARDCRRRSGEGVGGDEGEEVEVEREREESKARREEVAKADKEREGRLRRLKSLFSVRRKGGKGAAK